jgi:hypothetical protein
MDPHHLFDFVLKMLTFTLLVFNILICTEIIIIVAIAIVIVIIIVIVI